MSAAALVTSPNPSYPMNNTPAPNKIDFGPGHSAGDKFSAFTNHNPTPANSAKIATLIATITVSDRPISFAPKAFTSVSSNTDPTASDFTSSIDGLVVKNVAP